MFKNDFGGKSFFLKKPTHTEQMNILYLERLEFPLFVQMAKKSDALVVLLDRKQKQTTLSYIKISQISSFSGQKFISRCHTNKAPIPVSPEVTPPQYTVQLLGLD